MLKRVLLSLSLISLLTCTNILAEDISDDLAGFEEDSIEESSDDLAGFDSDMSEEKERTIESSHVKSSEIFSISGNVAFKTSLGLIKHEVAGVDYGGINQAQTSLYLQLDSKLSDDWKLRVSGDMFYDAIYDMSKNNNYSQEIKDDYKTQVRLDDTYLQGRLTRSLDIKLGRQIVIWGKSDSIRVTDVINPLDNRLPGMTDIEDLRLSVGMAKLDYYLGKWNFSAMAIAESRIMKEATPRSEFFPIDAIFKTAPNPFLELQKPASSMDNMQYAFAVNGVFSGWDLSFYASHVLDQKWHIEKTKRVVSKVDMLGSAVNIASGSWLLKSELAFLSGVKYNTTSDEKNRLDVLIGFDYMGIKDSVVSLEVANRHIFDYESQMQNQVDFVDKNEMQTAIRLTRSFSNDTINTTALLSMFGSEWQNGGFARVWVDYEIMDALSTNVGIVDYIGGDKPLMQTNRDNDRIFADIKYSF